MQNLSNFIKDKLEKLKHDKEIAREKNDSIYLTYLYGRIDSYIELLNIIGDDEYDKS